MRADKKTPLKADKKVPSRGHKRGVIGYSKKSALLEDAITQMNAGKYGRSSAALKELLALDPLNMEARRLFATLHLRLGSLLPARQAFESLANEALERQDYWLAESLLREYLVAGPRCVPFIEKLGSVYREKGDALAASEEFAKAIDILIEDPDPDRPTLPAELYARIREIAPASPPAFRLASLFDAQSGDLIARVAAAPAQQAEEAPVPPAAVESLEPAASDLSTVTSDPVSGVMPWDDVPAETSVLPAQSPQPDSQNQIASSTAAPLVEPTAELPAASMAPPLVDESLAAQDALSDRASVEPGSSQSLPVSDPDNSTPVDIHDVEPASIPLTHEEMASTAGVSSGSEWGEASLPMPQDSWNTVSSETTGVAEAVHLPQSDASVTLPSPTSDVLPAPLPWEQVQETTITIPQSDVECPPVDLISVEAISAVSPEASSFEPAHSQETKEQVLAEPSLLAAVETTLSSGTTQAFSPDVAWSAPDSPAIEPIGSPSMSPEPSLTSSVVEERRPDAVIESVPPPMPWEQVQESSVSIDGSTQESVTFQAETAGSPPAQLREISPSETGAHVTLEVATTTPELGNVESHDAISAPTADGQTQPENPPVSGQALKIGEFSWASIFNSAWKFGSSSPAPHDSLHHASPIEPLVPAEPVLHQEAVVAPVPPEELTTGVTSGETGESMAAPGSPAEAVPSPLPWDQVQDTPITIPSAEIALSLADEPLAEPPAAQDLPIEIPDQVAIQDVPVAPLAFQEELRPVADSAEVSESKLASASQAGLLVSPMPWDQIQDMPVTIPPAESPGEGSAALVEISEEGAAQDAPAVAPALQEELTAGVPPGERGMPESMPGTGIHLEAASSPMPWDQVQDTHITIPSAEIALSSAVEPLAETPAMPVVPIEVFDEAAAQETAQVTAPIEASAVPAKALIEESSSLEAARVESAEPSFRFMDSKSAEVESIASTEVPRLQHPTLPDESPAVGHSPVHSGEFRIVSQREPLPVAQESIKPDAPVSSAEPALAASVSAEPAPPVLPQELLPVLQTLVDQLSVVTKAIPATSTETKSFEPVSRDQEVVPETVSLREPSKAPSSAELAANPSSAQMPPTEEGPPSQWKTGEVAVQTHRPSTKKRKYLTDLAPEPSPAPLPVEAQPVSPIEPVTQMASTVAEPVMPASAKEKDEWIRTGEAIRFVDQKMPEPTHLSPPSQVVQEEWQATPPAPSTAASAVDVLFQSSGRHTGTQTIERTAAAKPRPRLSAKLARVRIGLSVFVGSCFSTTRALIASIVGLAVLCVAMLAVAIGAVGLTWLVMEEKPNPAFQSLTTTPQRAMMDSSKNGYLLLLGFEADAAADPVQVGYERKPDRTDGEMAAVCQGGDEGMTGANQKNASASVAQGWYRSADPAGQFKTQADSLKSWMSQANVSIGRYRQWLKMPFEDWGHGQAVAPPCAAILFAHRLHVAEGFSQGASTEAGVERLEGDMEAWRTTLGQAKTLPVKMMALQAINDDIAVASGLLVKPDFDGKALPRITKMLRPLDPVESSMRWPMQSQLVLATKSYEAQLDADRGEDVPFHVSVASMLPLPKQRRFNDYAEYYEASYKAAGEARYGAMPKRSTYIKYPANSVMDYLTNPIENIVGIDPLPAWDHYNGLVIDTDAHLRLASLQSWLRRGPQDADLLARIAKAGQRLYDPYTGLPMLVNLRRGVMYSVGHDGKDQDADPQQDVVVSIPLNQSASTLAKPASKSK